MGLLLPGAASSGRIALVQKASNFILHGHFTTKVLAIILQTMNIIIKKFTTAKGIVARVYHHLKKLLAITTTNLYTECQPHNRVRNDIVFQRIDLDLLVLVRTVETMQPL